MENVASLSPQQARQLIRAGKLCRPTSGVSQGYAQANLAILPKDLAYDFLLFAQRNPQALSNTGRNGSRLPGASLSRKRCGFAL